MSPIQKLIEQDETVLACKKRAKLLYKQLKKSDSTIKLMHCQIKVAQEMGYKDWFDLYNSVKNKLQSIDFTNDNPVIPVNGITTSNYFDQILETALKSSATDIHIKVTEKNSAIHLRLNGELKLIKKDTYENMYNLAKEVFYSLYYGYSNKGDIKPPGYYNLEFDPLGFQQVGNSYNIKNYKLIISYQCVPNTGSGFNIVLKLINQNENMHVKNLISLGFSPHQSEVLLRAMNKPHGTTIIASTTGAGKNTTLSTLLHESIEYNKNSKQIISIADSHPYPIAEVTQIPVVYPQHFDPNMSSVFSQPIRALKRMDPDTVFISEIKDKITCQEYVNAVEASININTSIIAANALAIIQRLTGYNIRNTVIAQSHFLNTLVYQTTVAVNCPCCAISVDNLFNNTSVLTSDHKNQYLKFLHGIEQKYLISNLTNIRIRNQEGCEQCNNTGFINRTVCAEVIEIDDIMREFIRKNQFKELSDYWRSLSDKNLLSLNMTGKTAMEHALHKMLHGQIDPLHLKDCFGDIK